MYGILKSINKNVFENIAEIVIQESFCTKM